MRTEMSGWVTRGRAAHWCRRAARISASVGITVVMGGTPSDAGAHEVGGRPSLVDHALSVVRQRRSIGREEPGAVRARSREPVVRRPILDHACLPVRGAVGAKLRLELEERVTLAVAAAQ